jgi:hypothetical protein
VLQILWHNQCNTPSNFKLLQDDRAKPHLIKPKQSNRLSYQLSTATSMTFNIVCCVSNNNHTWLSYYDAERFAVWFSFLRERSTLILSLLCAHSLFQIVDEVTNFYWIWYDFQATGGDSKFIISKFLSRYENIAETQTSVVEATLALHNTGCCIDVWKQTFQNYNNFVEVIFFRRMQKNTMVAAWIL